jgi:hypothetical protein
VKPTITSKTLFAALPIAGYAAFDAIREALFLGGFNIKAQWPNFLLIALAAFAVTLRDTLFKQTEEIKRVTWLSRTPTGADPVNQVSDGAQDA